MDETSFASSSATDIASNFMRNFFSGGLKDNPHLAFGFLTGILRIAKESIFGGLNNLKINSILDKRYSEYFGFTAGEVPGMSLLFVIGAEDVEAFPEVTYNAVDENIWN